MVTPALRDMFAAEGIGVIPLEAGANLLADELGQAPGTKAPVEVVVLGQPAKAAPVTPAAPVIEESSLRESVKIELNVERYHFLRSHVLDGKAVLPVAMIVEWLAHSAIKDNPGLAFSGVDDLRVFKGVVLNGQTIALRTFVSEPEPTGDGGFIVNVELRSDAFLHVRARIVLADDVADAPQANDVALPDAYPHEAFYGEGQLFHGADFHAITDVEGIGDTAIAGAYRGAPAPATWIEQPLRGSWLADPLALDAAFQLMILWTLEQRGIASLPTRIGSYRQFRRAFPRDGGRIVVNVTEQSDHAAHADIDILDGAGKVVARLTDYECVIDASLNDAFTRNTYVTHAI